MSFEGPKDLSSIIGKFTGLNISARHDYKIQRLRKVSPRLSKHMANAPLDQISAYGASLQLYRHGDSEPALSRGRWRNE